jgi:YVTN family beta-propeller protein
MSPRLSFVLGCAAVLVSSMLVASTSAEAITAPAAEVYVADFNGAAVSQYGVNSAGTVAPLPYPSAPSGTRPSHVIVSPNGKFAYALDCQLGRLYQYTVDTSGLLTGALVPMSPAFLSFGGCNFGVSESAGHMMAENKTGTYVFVTGIIGFSNDQLFSYKVNSTTGALTFAHFADELTTDNSEVAIAPSGKFAYVTTATGIVFSYKVDTTGAMTALAFQSVGGCPSDIAMAPSGKWLYFTDKCNGTLRVFTANGTTGAIASAQIRFTGAGPSAVVASPSGKGVYVTNATSNSVSQFVVNTTTGIVSSLSPASWPVGLTPNGLAIAKSGKSLYVSNSGSNSMSAFNINTTTQLLTPKPVPTLATGGTPWGVAARN